MLSLNDLEKATLERLGERLRRHRIERGDRQAVFAARLGVSEPTCRKIERGDPTVQVGCWVRALYLLGRLEDLDEVLADRESLFDRWDREQRNPTPKPRRRVSRK